ncbi:Beta-lactamase [compost metagenome]
MFSPATATTEADVPHYGFGWRLNGRAQWHSGESIGFRNVILRYPDKHLTVIVLSNRNAPEPYPLALKIAQRWLDTLQ